MRVLFMGTGDIAIPTFLALLESEFEIVGLVTQPDKAVGRKQVMSPPQIKVVAEEAAVPVLQPESAKTDEFYEQLLALDVDVTVVMAYGQILTCRVIEAAKLACINSHASLLPRHRGASCIQAAISMGDTETGITVMHVVKSLDAGDIIYKETISIGENETCGELHDRLAEVSPQAVMHAVMQIADGTSSREVQDDTLSNYAPKLLRNDGEIDWSKPAEEVERMIRAYHPWPGTFTNYRDKKGKMKRLKVFPQVEVVPLDSEISANGEGVPGTVNCSAGALIVRCGEGSLQLSSIQPEGSKMMPVEAFLQGQSVRSGDIFGNVEGDS